MSGTGAAEFARQLTGLGFVPAVAADGVVIFPFAIPIGGRVGEQVRLGFNVPPDFPSVPPGGPMVSPCLGHPDGAVHPVAQMGPDWEYWSRPASHWAQTDRSVRAYLAHIRALFARL